MRGLYAWGLALAMLIAVPSTAKSYYYENPQGPYWGAFGVFTATTDAHFVIDFLPGTPVDMKHDFGWGAGVSLGYQVWLGLRWEAEFSYRHSKIRELYIGDTPHASDGKVEMWGLLFNMLYEAECEIFCMPVRPYIGGGAGIVNVHADHVDDTTLVDDACNVAGYQVIAGIAYPITKCMWISGEYRFLGLTDWKFSGSGQTWEGKQNVYVNSVGVAMKMML